MTLPTSRYLARLAGAKHYCTGKPCKHGHVAPRFTSIGKCTACHVSIEQRRRAENPAKHRAAVKRYMAKNPNLAAEKAKQWRAENPEKKKTYAREYLKSHAQEHCDRQKRRYARTGASPVKPTPAEKILIRQVYAEARRRTESTGVPHHVDHIIPLARGGLHLPHNLQILTAAENIAKSDRLPEALEAVWPIQRTRR